MPSTEIISIFATKPYYVTLNGERIRQNNAEKKFEFWRQPIERKQREHPLLIKRMIALIPDDSITLAGESF